MSALTRLEDVLLKRKCPQVGNAREICSRGCAFSQVYSSTVTSLRKVPIRIFRIIHQTTTIFLAFHLKLRRPRTLNIIRRRRQLHSINKPFENLLSLRMAPENEERYVLHGEYLASPKLMTLPDILAVISAQITRSFRTKSSNLHVAIRLDEAATQHTSLIEGDTAPIWNEEFFVYVQLSP
jgi:hypothetical protein